MKRRRNRPINKKNKLLGSQFQDLSNDLIYEIFDYLDYGCVYDIFSNLNRRLQSLVLHLSSSLKIKLLSTSQSTYQRHCQTIITPKIRQFVSLNVSKYFLDFFSIDFFSSLESFTIAQIDSEKISPLIKQLTSLPRLSSLTVDSSDYFQDENLIYLAIFSLTKLAYCKLTFPSSGERLPLPLATHQCSPLQSFILNGRCRLDQLISILSYLPQLRHFSCHHLHSSGCSGIDTATVSEKLTSLRLNLDRISFEELRFFLSKVSKQLKTLRISKHNDEQYFHAEKWEELIENFMPCLCTFDLQSTMLSSDDDERLWNLIDRFSSTFWFERKWFFDHYYYSSDDSCYLNFFSITPYRFDHFLLHESIDDSLPKSFSSNNKNFARHLTIEGCLRKQNYSIQFPKITKLTLKDNQIEENTSFIEDINSIIPLQQIIDLDIKQNQFSLSQFDQFLQFLPNLQVLTISNLVTLQSPQRDNISSSSRSSRITKVSIHDDDECKLEHVYFLHHLFPHLQCLEIGVDNNELEAILRFLLVKIKDLYSISLFNINDRSSKKVQTLIQKNNLLSHYTIERTHGGLYLWW